jgi:hypothetical protein
MFRQNGEIGPMMELAHTEHCLAVYLMLARGCVIVNLCDTYLVGTPLVMRVSENRSNCTGCDIKSGKAA